LIHRWQVSYDKLGGHVPTCGGVGGMTEVLLVVVKVRVVRVMNVGKYFVKEVYRIQK
jgi:hypothetical protein